jgi:hypothetical protein
MHFTPAGFPPGNPLIGDEIEIAMQHAPQPGRQFIAFKKACNLGFLF